MSQFMRWYSQAGTPEIKVAPHYDSAARSLRLEITQIVPPTPGQPNKKPMTVPLAIGLVGRDGDDLPLLLDGRPLRHGVIELTESNHSFVFNNVPEHPVLSLNRGFSAPVKLSLLIDADELRFLAAHDRDPFNRWQAVQTLAMTLLKSNVAVARSGGAPRLDQGLMDAIDAILNDAALEPAFIALTLSPPSEADIAREIGSDVDPDAVYSARRKLRATIGQRHGATLADIYERMTTPGAYRPDAQSAGRRALKNACLDLLAVTESAAGIA